MSSKIKSQFIKISRFPVFSKKGMKNHRLLKSIISTSCVSIRDYQIVLELLASGEIILDNDDVYQPLVHRLGKVLDIEFSQEFVDEQTT